MFPRQHAELQREGIRHHADGGLRPRHSTPLLVIIVAAAAAVRGQDFDLDAHGARKGRRGGGFQGGMVRRRPADPLDGRVRGERGWVVPNVLKIGFEVDAEGLALEDGK